MKNRPVKAAGGGGGGEMKLTRAFHGFAKEPKICILVSFSLQH